MTVDVPKFGAPPDLEESRSHHTEDFAIEVFQCTNPDEGRGKYVTILHTSTDMNETRSEMNKIVQFMMDRGFDVKHKSDLDADDNMVVDVIILGSEATRFGDAYSIIRRISMGFLGLVPYWDVLWYGTDYTPQPDMSTTMKPICSSQAFSLDGICLIQAHIRRRNDVAAWDGLYILALKEIENYIDTIMKIQSMRSATSKIREFKARVKSDNLWGPDAELFFAAVEIIRNARNTGAHPLVNLPKDKLTSMIDKGNQLIVEFDELAKKYGCPFRPPMFVLPIPPEYTAIHLKWLISLTQVTVAWISEYPEPSNSNSLATTAED